MKKSIATLIMSLLCFVGITSGQEQLLPDLVPAFGNVGGSESLSNIAIYSAGLQHRVVSCDDWTIIGPQIRGQRILSFRLSTVNIGNGHLRIREESGPDGIAFIQQYSMWDGKTCSIEETEIASIEAGQTRRKFPWARLALYEVAEDGGLGDRVACQVKRACCLGGLSQVCPSDTPCFMPKAGVKHTIDVGERDTYGINFTDQYIPIPIEEIPSGYYWVEVVSNPYHYILESNYDNNTVRFMIFLDQGAPATTRGTPVEIVDWEDFKCGS